VPEDRQSRIAFLRSRIEAARRSAHGTFDVPFRGQPTTLIRIQVRSDFPLYRIQSGRTHRAQAAYLDSHSELPKDFFSDPEDPRVQQAQHEILLQLINEEGLAADLADRGQWNPLVLTYDGFVVDGNRRLCALREEGEEYVQVVVLPEDAENREIYETEIDLQMAKETKAEYNWIDEGIHIRYGIEKLGEKIETIAERMRKDVDSVRDAIAALAVVDMYLEWLGQPGKYHLIPAERGGATEQAFKDLTQRLGTQTTRRLSRNEQQAIREACFAAIREGGGYNDVRRIANYIRTRPREFFDRVIETLPNDVVTEAEKVASARVRPETATPMDREDELLAELAESESTSQVSTPIDQMLAIVSDPVRARRAAPSLIRAAEDLAAEEKEAQRLVLPLQRIQRALNELSVVKLREDMQGLDEIARILAELIEQAERLTAEIDTIRSRQQHEE